MLSGLRAWLFWRAPRIWTGRTAYAFWVIEQRQRLTRKARQEERDRILVDREGVAYPATRQIVIKAKKD